MSSPQPLDHLEHLAGDTVSKSSSFVHLEHSDALGAIEITSEQMTEPEKDPSGSAGQVTGDDEEEQEEEEEEVEYVEEVVYEDAEDEDDAASEPATEQKEEGPTAMATPPTAAQAPSAPDTEAGSAKEPGTATPAEQDHTALPTSSSEGAAQSPAGAANASGASGVDVDLRQLEAQAAKVAKEVTQVAKDMSSKLTAGLRSAFGGGSGSGGGASEPVGAASSLSKLAGGLSSWWGSLDPAPQPARDETAERVAQAASNKASGELQQLFGLSADENLVEHFKCKLLQTYAANHNSFTPAIQMAFQGTLYVTDRHTCFAVEERGRKLPFKVSHSLVVKATRQRPARKGDLSDVLRMDLSNGQWLAFKDFDSGSALDSALALVEHLMEGSH